MQPYGIPQTAPQYGVNYQQQPMTPYNNQIYQQNYIRPELVPQNNQPQPPPIPARQINSVNDIKPNDVPMDGTISLFLMSDCSCIIAKQWNSRGTIDDVCFVPEPKNQEQTSQNSDILNTVLERLDNIESMLQFNMKMRKPIKQEDQNV